MLTFDAIQNSISLEGGNVAIIVFSYSSSEMLLLSCYGGSRVYRN